MPLNPVIPIIKFLYSAPQFTFKVNVTFFGCIKCLSAVFGFLLTHSHVFLFWHQLQNATLAAIVNQGNDLKKLIKENMTSNNCHLDALDALHG